MNKPTQPIKIVFFDIDETLYLKEEAKLPESITQSVLPRLKEKGIITAIATGRNIGAFPKALKPLIEKGYFDLFVTTNGQYNFYKDQLISEYALTSSQITRCIEKFIDLNIPYAFVSRDEIAVSEDNSLIREALSPIKSDYVIDPQHYLSTPVYQLLAFYSEEKQTELEQSGILADEFRVVRWHQNAVDMLKIENSKAKGINDVIKHFGLNIENTMAFGDGLNDIEMFKTVGFSVAMGNAEPELKTIANFVTKPINEDGILYALETLNII